MSDVLRQICAEKRDFVARRKLKRPQSDLEQAAGRLPSTRGFRRAIERRLASERFAVIAEIKKASPSRGLIRDDFNPGNLARAYADGGATCLSVLTDEPYFQGSDACLGEARDATDLPCLRKDFTLEPYQLFEARAIGADAILLIMVALDDSAAEELASLAGRLGLDVLVEVHDETELERALKLDAGMIGINNRNLKTLNVDLATTERLAPLVPDGRLLIAESGLREHADLERMARVSARCFLVGESLMRQDDVEAALRRLLNSEAMACPS